MRDGDIFKWSFNDHEDYLKRNPSTAYWCMDNRCVVVNGDLVDTYWEGVYNPLRTSSNSNILDPEKVDLEFVCNLNDIEFIKEYQIEDYDKVYNLSHQKGCYKVFAIDKGSQVSNKALRAKYSKLLEQAEYQKRSAEWDIERYKNLISELDNQA